MPHKLSIQEFRLESENWGGCAEGKGKGKRYDIKGARPTGVRMGYRVIKRIRKGILNTAKTPRDQENRTENQQEKVPEGGKEGGISKLG